MAEKDGGVMAQPTMSVDKAFPKTFLSGGDLRGDVTVTIAKVTTEMLAPPGQKRTELKYILTFRKAQKKLIVSPPVAHAIKAIHGDDMRAWEGKSVTLYRDRVKAFGKDWDVVRVRPGKPSDSQPDQSGALDEEPFDPETGEVYDEPGTWDE